MTPFSLSIKSLSSSFSFYEQLGTLKQWQLLIAFVREQLLKSEPEQLLDVVADVFFKIDPRDFNISLLDLQGSHQGKGPYLS